MYIDIVVLWLFAITTSNLFLSHIESIFLKLSLVIEKYKNKLLVQYSYILLDRYPS